MRTGTRVPTKTGVPPRMSGSEWTISVRVIAYSFAPSPRRSFSIRQRAMGTQRAPLPLKSRLLHQPRSRRPCGEHDALAAGHRRHGMPCETREEHAIAAIDALNFSSGNDQPAARPFARRHQRNDRRNFALVAGDVVVVRVRVGEIGDSVFLNAHRLENSRQREAPGVVPDKGEGQLLEGPRSVLRLQITEADAPVDPPTAASIRASVLLRPFEQLGTLGGGEQCPGNPHPSRPLDGLRDWKNDI